jgi:hypothetical protein
MKQATANQAAPRKARPAAVVCHSSCDSFFAAFCQLPPHLLEAVFLCPGGARASVRAARASQKAAWTKRELIA